MYLMTDSKTLVLLINAIYYKSTSSHLKGLSCVTLIYVSMFGNYYDKSKTDAKRPDAQSKSTWVIKVRPHSPLLSLS